MYCQNCGSELRNDAVFCEKCGANVKEKQETNVAKNMENVNLLEKSKGIQKKIYAGLAVAVIVLIGIICMVTAPPTINLNDYLEVEAKGYDGYGGVLIRIDWDSMEEDYADKLELRTKQSEAHANFWGVIEPMDVLYDEIDLDYEISSNWSNGDKVEYTWDVSEYISSRVKCKVKYKNGSYKVNGLKEIEKFNAFEKLDVEFVGVEPNGKVTFEYEGEYLTTDDFSCDKENGLKEGDTVTISIENFNPEAFIKKNGAVPMELEQTYTVPELGRYINTSTEFTKEFAAKLKEDAENALYAYIKENYLETSHATDIMYEGQIFLTTNKPESFPETQNIIYVLYSGNVTSSNNSFKPTKIYFPIKVTNIHMMNGELKYEAITGVVGTTRLESNSWMHAYATSGYADPYLCYQKLVSNEAANYNAEVTDGFENYAQ